MGFALSVSAFVFDGVDFSFLDCDDSDFSLGPVMSNFVVFSFFLTAGSSARELNSDR